MTQPTVSSQSVTAGGFTRTQLEVIKRFGRKELTEGCMIQQGEYLMNIWCIYEGIYNMKEINSANCMQVQKSDIGEILGHIPHLEDVFRLARDRKMFYGIKGEYVKEKEFEYIEYIWFSNIDIGEKYIPYNPSIPLLEQPESVLIELLTKIKGQ